MYVSESINGKNNGKNSLQDICIVKIQKDIEFILKEIKEIKENHLKGINEEIKNLKTKIEALKEELGARPSWLMTFLVSFCLMLISFIIGYFIVK